MKCNGFLKISEQQHMQEQPREVVPSQAELGWRIMALTEPPGSRPPVRKDRRWTNSHDSSVRGDGATSSHVAVQAMGQSVISDLFP